MTPSPRAPRPSNDPFAVRATAFSLPYHRPLCLASGIFTQHNAVLVELFDEEGNRGCGEIAPGPGTTAARAVAIARDISARQSRITNAVRAALDALDGVGDDRGETRRDAIAEMLPGIEAAALDLWARRRGERLVEALGFACNENSAVSVNAMVDRAAPEVVLAAIDNAVAAGYRCAKIKVAPADFDACCDVLHDTRRHHGAALSLRIDCNGQWTLPEARAALRRLECFDLDYVEQPVKALDELKVLRGTTGVPIAADESAANPELIARAIESRAIDVIILKPAHLGLHAALSAARLAADAGIGCVVTSNLDSSVGIASALHLALAIDTMHVGPLRAHGLGTAGLLHSDIATPRLLPRNGHLRAPNGAGCGVAPLDGQIRNASVE